MPLVTGYEVVGPGGVRTFQKFVIVGIFRNLERPRRRDNLCAIPDELEELLPQAPAYFEFPAREHVAVFGENGLADVEPGWFGDREHEHSALESGWFQSRRHKDVGVDDQPQRDHRRCGFSARAALMTWS